MRINQKISSPLNKQCDIPSVALAINMCNTLWVHGNELVLSIIANKIIDLRFVAEKNFFSANLVYSPFNETDSLFISFALSVNVKMSKLYKKIMY